MAENEEPTPQVDPARALRATYPANNKASKKPVDQPVKKLEKVIEGTAIRQKPPIGKRIRQAFTGDDARSVGDYLLFDVFLPALKTTISDMASQGVERLLFGEKSRTPGAGNRRPGTVNYNMISGRNVATRDEPRALSQRDRATHNFDPIVLPTRQDAETVLASMIDTIEQYDMATVSDLYELVGVTGNFTDDKWGWTNLAGADITRVRDGYVLDLPPTKPIR
jgi:hypothetical protein